MTKDELINIVDKINIAEYCCKGGVSKFNKKYPNLLKYINKYSLDMQIFSNNKKISAKLLFFSKYGGNIDNILHNGNVMIYDSKHRDFKIPNINSAKKQWDNCKNELSKINNYYSEKITRNKLKNIYKNFFGKSGNRKLIKYDNKLYLSLYHHTKEFDDLNKNLSKLSFRLFFFVHNLNIKCDVHNILKH